MAQSGRIRHPSYGWVWKVRKWPEARALSGKAGEGLYYAEKLALNGRERTRCAFSGPRRLTISALAKAEGVGAARIHDRIRQAQLEVFGRELSSSGIYYRLQRRKLLGETRPCAEEGCITSLPLEAPAHRRYCDQHRAPAARVARHRRSRTCVLS